MTSSLVGSEMCIRDSILTGTVVMGLLAACVSAMASRTRRHPPPGKGTVSYTHLTLPTICSV
eukprot:12780458-Prorocentrum_lima.AAC.1